jgi:lipoprotein-anchoring transpeptidase ErfK/SrfK
MKVVRSGDGAEQGSRRRHRLFRAAGALAAPLAAALLGAGTAQAGGGVSQPSSIVATAVGKGVAVYRAPKGGKPFAMLSNPTADGAPLTFLVKARTPDWIRVYVPMRPNGTTGWIRGSAVRLARDPFRVVVALGAHRITVRNGDRVVVDAPVGVGRAVVPTPVGTYFIVELLRQPDPAGPYGPYAFGLSAFSNVYQSFGSGPGSIGLHGTNEPWLLGHDVSHGCIRMSNAGIEKLARLLPLGTPVVITR